MRGRTVSLLFNFTYDVPPDYTGTEIYGDARVEACGGVCGVYSADFTIDLPTPAPTEEATVPPAEPSPSPTSQRFITIQGTVNALDPSSKPKR